MYSTIQAAPASVDLQLVPYTSSVSSERQSRAQSVQKLPRLCAGGSGGHWKYRESLHINITILSGEEMSTKGDGNIRWSSPNYATFTLSTPICASAGSVQWFALNVVPSALRSNIYVHISVIPLIVCISSQINVFYLHFISLQDRYYSTIIIKSEIFLKGNQLTKGS